MEENKKEEAGKVEETKKGPSMTVKEVYDFIVSKMTPEEALMKFLEGGTIEYQKLRFSEPGKEVHPLILMAMAAMEMEWGFMVEDVESSSEVRGLVTGTPEYMEFWVDRKEFQPAKKAEE